ncbi:hypothetical protein [Halobacillus amylolyticus]|uniref:Uncharacterized protein n=1 Tax=Halobacillus amylolyticus TaxID=2932259 RepID=A0ABY4HIC9_9BACI|nr:hypothetical protein [Halobacillus amylolyticus]UOR14088.1 hypothetical protein MUO15_21265 [Halobacillus amylolyticus]
MFNSWKQFITWEKETKDTIDFKKSYVDVIGEKGDIVSGLFLAQIVYWYLPNKDGKSKLRIKKEGHYWIAKEKKEWYEEIRLTPANYRTAMKRLVEENLVVKKIFKFDSKTVTHIRLNIPEFLKRLNHVMKDREDQIDDDVSDFEEYIQDEINKETSPDSTSDMGYVESTHPEMLNQHIQKCRFNTSRHVESTRPLTENTEENTTKNTNIDSFHSSSSIDRKNTIHRETPTKKNDDDDENINKCNLLINENSCFQYLYHYLEKKKIANKDITQTIIKCSEKEITSFTKADLDKQWLRVIDQLEKGSITVFSKFFVNGLAMILKNKNIRKNHHDQVQRDQAKATERIRSRQQLRSNLYYDWLENNEEDFNESEDY